MLFRVTVIFPVADLLGAAFSSSCLAVCFPSYKKIEGKKKFEKLKKLKEIQSMVEWKILRKGLDIWDDEVIWQDSQTDITSQMVCLHLTLD